jgi:hypothetical protein
MKVTLTFDLPDERGELLLALHAGQMCSAILDLDRELRLHVKHGAVLDVVSLRRDLWEAMEGSGWIE